MKRTKEREKETKKRVEEINIEKRKLLMPEKIRKEEKNKG